MDSSTCGILNSLRRFATWIDVTDDAAPTTPDTTTLLFIWRSANDPSLQIQPSWSMLLMEPESKSKILWDYLLQFEPNSYCGQKTAEENLAVTTHGAYDSTERKAKTLFRPYYWENVTKVEPFSSLNAKFDNGQ